MLGFIISLAIVGLIAGAIARLLVPGRDPMGCLGTMALGIAGSFLGGFLLTAIATDEDAQLTPVGILGSILGAVLVLLILRAVSGNRGRSRR